MMVLMLALTLGQSLGVSHEEECGSVVAPTSSVGVPAAEGVVVVGFLASWQRHPLALGAVPLAVSRVDSDPSLLPGLRMHVLSADIGSRSGAAPGQEQQQARRSLSAMTHLRDRGAIAFLGPDDICSSEALLAAAWNLPIIAYNCAEPKELDKSTYCTLARTLPSSSKAVRSIVSLLKAFSWDQLVLLVSQRPAWMQIAESLKDACKTHGIRVTEMYTLIGDYLPVYKESLEKVVNASYQRTRVYVFVGEHVALVDLVRIMWRMHLLASGDYVIVSLDDHQVNPEHPDSASDLLDRDYWDPYLRAEKKRDHSASEEETDLYHREQLRRDEVESMAQAFRSVLWLNAAYPRDPNYMHLARKVKDRSLKPPFCLPPLSSKAIFQSLQVPEVAAYMYDAVILYALALTEVLREGGQPNNGTLVLQHMRNRTYPSVFGYDVAMDNLADAEGNFSVVALQPDDGSGGNGSLLGVRMRAVGFFQWPQGQGQPEGSKPTQLPEFRLMDPRQPIWWVGKGPPKARPPCGFDGELCRRKEGEGEAGNRGGPGAALVLDWPWALLAGMLLLILGSFGTGMLLRHLRQQRRLASLLWKVDPRQVVLLPAPPPHASSAPSSSAPPTTLQMAVYKGAVVVLKQLPKRSMDLTRSMRRELNQMREIRHENLVPFLGVSVEPGNVFVLTAFCARGSLQDVLANKDLRLDNIFVASLVADLLKGMIYLQDSELVSHGNLTSSNCLVDSRWVLQVADYGLHEFKAGGAEEGWQEGQEGQSEESAHVSNSSWKQQQQSRRLLWRAPELLRAKSPPSRGTQSADVYSFGIVLFEMVGRQGPWGQISFSDREIVERVAYPSQYGGQLLRPPLDTLKDCPAYLLSVLRACWEEDIEQRPDLRFVRVRLKPMQQGLKPNIFDNMLVIMEKHASNLETLVQERTRQLSEEQQRTQVLLHRMLPRSVADSLLRGEPVQAEFFASVSIFFSDVVGFTLLSAQSSPLQVVQLLNELYTCCDSILAHYDVYKVETIGDAYMVVSGLPLRNGLHHASELCSMALHLLSRLRCFRIRHRPEETLRLRIGVHSGPCVAGVVGLQMPRYCLFGDTVNTASRMESTGQPLRVHISQDVYLLLRQLGGFRCQERGLIPVKGKGRMRTYWLLGEAPWRAHRRLADPEVVQLPVGQLPPQEKPHQDKPPPPPPTLPHTPDLLLPRLAAESCSDLFSASSNFMRTNSQPQSSESVPPSQSKNTARYLSAPTIPYTLQDHFI